MTNLAALNEQFGLASQLVFKAGLDGLTIAEVNNDEATATVAQDDGRPAHCCLSHQCRMLFWHWTTKLAVSSEKRDAAVRSLTPICSTMMFGRRGAV
jgi:hypothetical protein